MHLFDQDIAVTREDPFHCRLNVSGNWSINGSANGGYLTALLARAMLLESEKEATPIVTLNFIAPCKPGEAVIALEKIACTSRFDRLEARLYQGGKEKVRALGTFASALEAEAEVRYESPPPEVAPLQECIQIPEIPNYSLYNQMDVRLDPGCAGWLTGGKLSEKSELKGWIRFRDERPFDTLAIMLIADAFPPPVLASHGVIAWVPTIEFSVNVRCLSAAQWLKCIFRTRFINNAMVDEYGEVWDESGQLMAICRQFAQLRTSRG